MLTMIGAFEHSGYNKHAHYKVLACGIFQCYGQIPSLHEYGGAQIPDAGLCSLDPIFYLDACDNRLEGA